MVKMGKVKTSKRIVTDNPDKLLQIKSPIPEKYDSHTRHFFDISEVRKKFSDNFNINAVYHLLRTTFNPVAVEEISNLDDYHRAGLRFDIALMDLYLKTLGFLAEKQEINHFYYKLMTLEGEEASWGNRDTPYWPIIHVIQTNNVNSRSDLEKFIDLTQELNSDKAYEFIKKIEAPQNYHMKPVKHLRSIGVEPLILEKRTLLNRTGKEVKDIIDFFCQFNYSTEYNVSSLFDY